MAAEFPKTLAEFRSADGAAVAHVRGSLIVSSLQTLRELGLYSRYVEQLPSALQPSILFAIASSWLPVDLALAHYGACDAMGLKEAELDAMGQHVAARILNTFLGTLLRGSRIIGAQPRPVVVLQNYPRLWERLLQGGGCSTRQTGLKDAVVESLGVPMFRYPYFRHAYASLIRGAGLIFGRTIYTRTLRASDMAMTIGVSWV